MYWQELILKWMWRFLVAGYLAGAILLIAQVAWGADGDAVQGASMNRGDYVTRAIYLCDQTSGFTTCADLDLNDHGGWPRYMTVELASSSGCGGTFSVTVEGRGSSTGAKHDLQVLDSTTTAAVIWPAPYRYLSARMANTTGCSEVKVVLTLFFERTGIF